MSPHSRLDKDKMQNFRFRREDKKKKKLVTAHRIKYIIDCCSLTIYKAILPKCQGTGSSGLWALITVPSNAGA